MSHSPSSASALDVTDAYRESFKYFKSYILSSSPKNSRRKKSKNKSANLGQASESEFNSISNSCSASNEEEQLDNGQRILLPYPNPKCNDDNGKVDNVIRRDIDYDAAEHCECYKMWGLRHPESWTVVELAFPKGLIVIKNPFTPAGQRYWISRALLDFPHHVDYVTNMDNLNRLERKKKGQSVEEVKDFKLDTCSRDFYEKLRWVTFGYHHDWDTKIYSERMRSNFPEDLADMTKYISQFLRFSQFEAEAAIANYYHMDSTLSGHIDRSEVNQHAPLFSLSFGQSAIFLIGGKTKSDVPQPVLLQSGDIAIMSGESRMSYHGVPKILPSQNQPWNSEQAYDKKGQESTPTNGDGGSCQKRQKLELGSDPVSPSAHECASFRATMKDPLVFNKMTETHWTDFIKNYIEKSRINLNIRQVLFPGQSCLS